MNLFEFIKEHVSILDVVQEYVALKPAGSYWKGFSPFKSERTPSFTVSPSRGIYYCFSTGNGGDAIDFITKLERCTPLEAAHMLIERFNISVPEQLLNTHLSQDKDHNTSQKSYEKSCKVFMLWCQKQLESNPSASAYVKDRGLSEKTLSQFSLGFCPNGSKSVQNLLAFAQSHALLAQQFIQANLLVDGQHGLYLTFDDRIIFPIGDPLGRIRGFGGRIFKENDTRAKYYNSREHDYFNKKNILFGFHLAKKEIQATGQVFLVEGYIDCIAMVQAGYTNCVATLGTSCTLEHLTLLSRHANKVFVMYDGDEAGQKAILRLAQLCWQVQLELFVIQLPAEHDPASFLQEHGSLSKLQQEPQPLFSFFTQRLGNGFLQKNLQEKLEIVGQFLETIATLNDPIQQDILLQQAAQTFDMPFNALKEKLKRQNNHNPSFRNTTQPADKTPLLQQKSGEGTLEKKIFSVILNNSKVLTTDDSNFLKTYLAEPFRTLLQEYCTHNYDFGAFFAKLSQDQQHLVSSLAMVERENCHETAFRELMTQLQRKEWRRLNATLKEKIVWAQQAGDIEMVQETLAEMQKVQEILLRKGNS